MAIIITYISVYFNVKNLREIILLPFCFIIFLLKCVIILVFVYINVIIVKQVRSLLPSSLVIFLFRRNTPKEYVHAFMSISLLKSLLL